MKLEDEVSHRLRGAIEGFEVGSVPIEAIFRRGKRRGRERLVGIWLAGLMLAMTVAAPLVFLSGIRTPPHGAEPGRTGDDSTRSDGPPSAEGPPFSVDDPLVNGIPTTEGEAASHLAFDPVVPEALGEPLRLVMTTPDVAGTRKEDLAFAVVYDHPDYGRFYIVQAVPQTTQAELESLAGCDPSQGCEGEWSLVTIRSGVTALLIEGPVANSVIWLEDGVRFDVVGPAETFSAEEVLEVANRV